MSKGKEILNNSSQIPTHTLQEKLKILYSLDNTIHPFVKNDRNPVQPIDDYYVDLWMVMMKNQENASKNAAIDKVGGEKVPVDEKTIFDNASDSDTANKIFVLGAPGVGKTTLLQNLSYQWANYGLWQDKFDFVIRVRLKEMLKFKNDWSYQGRDIFPGFIYKCLISQAKDLFLEDADVPTFEFEEIKKLLRNDQLKSKTLLLVDGYDEIINLEYESKYNIIIGRKNLDPANVGGILGFPNVIITSSPSAVDDQILKHFPRKIINNGLDTQGTNRYIKNFFKDDKNGQANKLQDFLSKNENIQDLSKTPSYISLICNIWQDKADKEKQKNNNKTDELKVYHLYENIIFELTKRYLENKEHYHQAKNLKPYEVFTEYITKALKDVAYYHFVSGDKGLDAESKDKSNGIVEEKEFISGGATGIGGILLKKFLQKHHQKRTDLDEVIKFGLLNAEGNSEDITEKRIYFTHLAFKEYLTACKMYDFLRSNGEKGCPSKESKLVAEEIATNRNNPQYLITLKFLSGIVSDSENEVVLKRFWQSVSCNLDGVIELGSENKIKLFMHLLGQSKASQSPKNKYYTIDYPNTIKRIYHTNPGNENGYIFDLRIPNLEQLVTFIEYYLKKDGLNFWQDEIISSGYMSQSLGNILSNLIKIKTEDENFKPKIAEIKSAINIILSFIDHKLISTYVTTKESLLEYLSNLSKDEYLDLNTKKFCLEKIRKIAEKLSHHKEFSDSARDLAEQIQAQMHQDDINNSNLDVEESIDSRDYQRCHKLLKKAIISEHLKELISKCIIEKNMSFTFIPEKLCVIFEGCSYKISLESKKHFHDMISSIIDTLDDPLANQYKTYKPLFLNEDKSVISIANVDKDDIWSVVNSHNKIQLLPNENKGLISLVLSAKRGNILYNAPPPFDTFIVYEERDIAGVPICYKFYLDKKTSTIKYKYFYNNRDITEIFNLKPSRTDDVISDFAKLHIKSNAALLFHRFVVNKGNNEDFLNDMLSFVELPDQKNYDPSIFYKILAKHVTEDLSEIFYNFDWDKYTSYIDDKKIKDFSKSVLFDVNGVDYELRKEIQRKYLLKENSLLREEITKHVTKLQNIELELILLNSEENIIDKIQKSFYEGANKQILQNEISSLKDLVLRGSWDNGCDKYFQKAHITEKLKQFKSIDLQFLKEGYKESFETKAYMVLLASEVFTTIADEINSISKESSKNLPSPKIDTNSQTTNAKSFGFKSFFHPSKSNQETNKFSQNKLEEDKDYTFRFKDIIQGLSYSLPNITLFLINHKPFVFCDAKLAYLAIEYAKKSLSALTFLQKPDVLEPNLVSVFEDLNKYLNPTSSTDTSTINIERDPEPVILDNSNKNTDEIYITGENQGYEDS